MPTDSALTWLRTTVTNAEEHGANVVTVPDAEITDALRALAIGLTPPTGNR